MTDAVQITFDIVALAAFLVFTALSWILARSMKGSALKRGFSLAGTAGLVHLVANMLTVAGDFGIISSAIPLLGFAIIQSLFAILLALSVRSFFPAWYKGLKKSIGSLPGPNQ